MNSNSNNAILSITKWLWDSIFIDYSYSFTDIKMNYYQYKVDFKTKKQYI
jgi:hypothetical protein